MVDNQGSCVKLKIGCHYSFNTFYVDRHAGDLENIMADVTGKAIVSVTAQVLKLEKVINR